MAKKDKNIIELSDEDVFRNRIRVMTFVDLHSIFIFISGDYNKQFGGKLKAKQLISSRYNIVLDELNRRSYGGNPYKLDSVTTEGEIPENIDLSKFDEEGGK